MNVASCINEKKRINMLKDVKTMNIKDNLQFIPTTNDGVPLLVLDEKKIRKVRYPAGRISRSLRNCLWCIPEEV